VKNKILVINPGSTSTKIAVFSGKDMLWQESIPHSPEELKAYPRIFDQLDMRTELVRAAMKAHDCDTGELQAIAARGGLLPPAPAGAVEVNELMLDTLEHRPTNHHASNLAAAIAYRIAQPLGIKAYIYDPVTTDEMIDVVRITGLKEVRRYGQGHNLNMRAAAMEWCASNGLEYRRQNIIVAHMGGGTTLSLHSQGRIIDMVSDDEGPFSPERAGELPTYRLMAFMENNGLDRAAMMPLLHDNSGLYAWFGTKDMRQVEKMAVDGDAEAALVLQAMALAVSKNIAKLSVVVQGQIDQIILTGGIAYSGYITDMIISNVSFIAPVSVLPGENEMRALASGIYRVLQGKESARIYQ